MLQGPWVVRPDAGLLSPEPESGPLPTLSESFSDHTTPLTPVWCLSLVATTCHTLPDCALVPLQHLAGLSQGEVQASTVGSPLCTPTPHYLRLLCSAPRLDFPRCWSTEHGARLVSCRSQWGLDARWERGNSFS